MLFNSLEFIFLFLPLAVFFFYAFRKKSFQLATVILVLFSLFFYAYWNPPYILLLLGSIAVNFLFGVYIGKNRGRTALISVIVFNLALLAYFKYTIFFFESYGLFTGKVITLPDIILPIGISFFTFQQIAYQVDVYKGQVSPHSFWDYVLFVTFFPHLIAGPVLHHNEMLPQFARRAGRSFHIGNIVVGLTIFSIGLFKKVVIADSLSLYVSPIFDDALGGKGVDFYAAWVAALGYTFQLYFDFSGYSDMAVGAARLFGIRLPVNFFSPYKATSIIDFWRRWHITLSRFFRNYLYIPLGGNRKGYARQQVNLFVTMVLVGFWHGAGWSFIIWGAFHGVLLAINHLWRRFRSAAADPGLPKILVSSFATFLLVVIGWVFFRAESMEAAMLILKGMFGANGFSLPVHFFHYELVPDWLPVAASVAGAKVAFLIVAAMLIAFLMPNTTEIMRKFRPVLMPGYKISSWSLIRPQWQPTILWAVFISVLFLWAVASLLSGESEFLYYNF